MTTLLQLKNEVQAAGPFDTVTLSSGRITLWINQAQFWFNSKRRWSYLETAVTFATVSGQADYVVVGTSPVVTDFGQLIDISHNQANAGTTFLKLRYMPQQDFDDVLGAAGATPGIPIFYTLRGGAPQTTSATILAGGNQRLSVWPVMNYVGSARMAYFRSVASTQLTADTDVSIVPEEWQSALVWKAASIGMAMKGAMIESGNLAQMAEEIASQAVAADSIARRGDQTPQDQPVMPPTIPPNPSAGANPANSPYGIRVA
jgi:hypothetical protein